MAQRKTQKQRKTQRKVQKAGGGDWLKEVKEAHKELKRKDKNASLGQAMKLASTRRKNKNKH
jgi:hypothetical protein